jgi:plasmid stability protein
MIATSGKNELFPGEGLDRALGRGYHVASYRYQAPRTERDWEVPQRQANVRLEDELFEKIEVAAFVHRRSFAEEMRKALEVWVESLAEDPLIVQASRSREEIPPPEGATVTDLATKKRGVGKRNA